MKRQPPATADELHAAWLQRRRRDWPESFDDVMADPLLAGVVRTTALARRIALQRVQQRQAAAFAAAAAAADSSTCTAPPAPAPVAPSPQPPSRQPYRRPAWDARRAAANDLEPPDDDDDTDPRQ